MDGAGRGEVAHPWPWPRAVPWLGLERSGLLTIAQTPQGPTDQRKEPWRLGERESTGWSATPGCFSGRPSLSPAGVCTLDRPCSLLFGGEFTAAKQGFFCRRTAQKPGDCLRCQWHPVGKIHSSWQRSTGNACENEHPHARALLFLEIHKGALFPDTGPKCWLQLSMTRFPGNPRAWIRVSLYCVLFI